LNRLSGLLAALLAVLLVVSLIAAYVTRQPAVNSTQTKQLARTPLIDGRLFQIAQQMAAAADTPDERTLSRDALRLADHELDQAFASALRETLGASVPVTGPLKQLADRITRWKTQIAAQQERIAKLTKQAATDSAAADQLELVKAQLELDQDELEDAQQDLARQGGDQHAKLQQALQDHESAQHQVPQAPSASTPEQTTTLIGQVRTWIALRERGQRLQAARQQALGHASDLGNQHNDLEQQAGGSSSDGSANSSTLAQLRSLSGQKKSLADFDKRIQDSQHLADVYARWGAAVQASRRDVLHLLLISAAEALAILLAMVLIGSFIRRAFDRKTDHRRFHQLRVTSTVAVQLMAVLFIVLIVFGPPNQLSTIIGLATAGLTVALKDFIVAFLGWFALMGRNGIHIGDWVEIEGVGGEVVEIGLLKTVLLEVGSSGGTGHPTGRRVSFVNNFAIEGHYFNFSTAGQWLWDELQISLPGASDPYQVAERINEIVARITEPDASEAEKDWERVTRQYGTRPFSAKPVAELRPAASGLDLVVRYITRAPQRQEVKSRLFKEIVDLLHKSASEAQQPPPEVTRAS
jgi:small-conductance mechanosensitive channel